MRYIALISLLISGIAALYVDHFAAGLCVYEYLAAEQVVYLKDLAGVSNDDIVMLEICGIFSILFVFILVACKNKIVYGLLSGFLLLIQIMLLNMMDTLPYKSIIYHSIYYCGNTVLLIWLISLITFYTLSVLNLWQPQD